MSDSVPRVSVIIIFLNPGATFLEEAIASVWAQTLEDWELLLVDDGSTDDSTAAAKAAAAAAPGRIRYLEHPGHANRGMSASRNRGIAAARGRYVTFLDADDVYLPERLAHQVDILERHPKVAMVYGPTLYWHSWQANAATPDTMGRLGLATDVPHEPPTLLRAFLQTSSGIMPGICSLTVRRNKALAVGCFEETFRGCYEDQVFISKICAQERVLLTERCLDYYRQHDASCSANAKETGEYADSKPHPARERFLRWLHGHVTACRLDDPALHRALRRELWPYDHPLAHRAFVMPLYAAKQQLKRLLKPVIRSWLAARRPATVSASD